ncbi:IS701 family transposase [Streptomyces luteolus]|uniref:Transposase n=1 Tax=Streptomyces luteolus TaxID=3043615 RepID=A0ABT6SSB3_9ACTN|nr:transposase [Streptomyces sp. B-S-A12]MDI3418489.1 transposase [Streptomyces sp. B-S-A12]
MSAEPQNVLPAGISPRAVSELFERALHTLPRSDQRRWGALYVRSLLSVEGKKTMRALANGAGGSTEQSLYQFISKSPWDCDPIRRTVAQLFRERTQPRAWVVHPLVVEKVGQHSVGVERRWVSQIQRLVNCQQSMSTWLVSDQASCPVDWRLALPECWTDEPDLRRRAAIPEDVGACPPEQCAVGSLAKLTDTWGMEAHPVVIDLRETDPSPICAELAQRRIPFVVRVDPAARFTSLELPGPRRTGIGPNDAVNELVTALSWNAMPVEWFDHGSETVRATAIGTTKVRLRRQELTLLGAWAGRGQRTPSEYWLSSLSHQQPGTVFRTAMLSRRVERDLTQVSVPLGVRDFEGRSFRGWHHHMTMVSLAHAATMLSTVPRAATARMPGAAKGTTTKAVAA